MANYPQELAQDAAYQSHTSRLTELCSLPKPAQGLNTYNNILFIIIIGGILVLFIYITRLASNILCATLYNWELKHIE